jgi:hypothetical protein
VAGKTVAGKTVAGKTVADKLPIKPGTSLWTSDDTRRSLLGPLRFTGGR